MDLTGKAAGRGSYLHDRRSCWERGLKGALAHALKTELNDQDYEILRSFMNTLPQDTVEDRLDEFLLKPTPNANPLKGKRHQVEAIRERI